MAIVIPSIQEMTPAVERVQTETPFVERAELGVALGTTVVGSAVWIASMIKPELTGAPEAVIGSYTLSVLSIADAVRRGLRRSR